MKIVLYGNFIVEYCSEVHHAKSLEALGHEVIRLQETRVMPDRVLAESLNADMLVWIHSHGPDFEHEGMEAVLDKLRDAGIPTVAYHLDLYMPLPERWAQYKGSAYMNHLAHFFTVDQFMADWLNENSTTAGHYLPPGVFDQECYIDTSGHEWANDVIFVGSRGYHHEWPYRPQLIDWLKATYGERFSHIGGDGKGVVRGEALNRLYAGSKVVVGDSLCIDFTYPYYWSDRVYETMGRGGFLIMPRIKGLDEQFKEGVHMAYYDFGDFEQLKAVIDYYLDTPHERERIRLAGHEEVKAKHTYVDRWREILNTIGGSDVSK